MSRQSRWQSAASRENGRKRGLTSTNDRLGQSPEQRRARSGDRIRPNSVDSDDPRTDDALKIMRIT